MQSKSGHQFMTKKGFCGVWKDRLGDVFRQETNGISDCGLRVARRAEGITLQV
jgi:hypothetical protein